MKYYYLALLLIFVQCKSDHSSDASRSTFGKQSSIQTSVPQSEEPMADLNQEVTEIVEASQIIRKGNMNFKVEDIEAAKTRIDSLVLQSGGYYESEQYHDYHSRLNYSLTIRIPNKNFDSLINDLESTDGELTGKNISATDVTEEYVDLNIRLENNMAYLKQYKEILKKAKTIKEILEVQEKIRRIEVEIESKKGKLKFLSNQVEYSTLHININQEIEKPLESPGFIERVKDAFANGFDLAKIFLLAMITIWPLILLIIVFIIFKPRIFNKIRRTDKK